MAYVISINPDVLFQEIQGESVLLHPDQSKYFGLDETGTRAWRLFSDHTTLDEVMEIMLREYEVDPERLRADLEKLVADLVEDDLVRLT